MWNVCPKCNHLNSDDSTRCEQCKTKLTHTRPTRQSEAPVRRLSETTALEAPQPQNPSVPLPQQDRAVSYVVPEPATKHFDLNEWFGPMTEFEEKRRRKFAFIGLITLIVVFAFISAYAASGAVCNVLLWLLLGALLFWAIYSLAKEKWTVTTAIAVSVFLILPVFIAAVFPWQSAFEEKTPVFVDHISASHQGAHVTVKGYISNEGHGRGQAMVTITAYGGSPLNATQLEQSPEAYKTGTVYTDYVEPGDSAPINWECTLSYYNYDGMVYWTITDTTHISY